MTRTARIVAVALAAFAAQQGVARAQDARQAQVPRPAWLHGAPPAGWGAVPGLGRNVGTALMQSAPFGGPARAGAVAHVQRGSGAFYLSWLESDQAAPVPAEAARVALDRLRESRVVSSPEARSTEELRYDESLDGGVAEARLEWRHISNETLSLVRAFVWLSRDGKPRLAVAECVASTSGGKPPPAVEKACRDALGSVAVAVPPAERGALPALPPSRAGDGAEPAGPGGGDEPAAAAAGATPATVGPATSSAEGRVLYRGPEPKAKKDAISKWLILLGAAMLLIAFYLTARARRGGQAANDSDSSASDPVRGSAPAATADPASGPEDKDER